MNDVVIGSNGKPVEYETGKGIAFGKIHGSAIGTQFSESRNPVVAAAFFAAEAASAISGATVTAASVAAPVVLTGAAVAGQANGQEMSEAQRLAYEKAERKKAGMDAVSNLYLRQFEENAMTEQRYNEFRQKWNETVNDQTFDSGEQRTRQNPTLPKTNKKGTAGRVLGEIFLPESETLRADREAARQQQQIALQTAQQDALNQQMQQQQVAQGIIDGVNQFRQERTQADLAFLQQRQDAATQGGLNALDIVQAKRDAVTAYKELNGKDPVEKVTPFEPVIRQRPERRDAPEKQERDGDKKPKKDEKKKEGAALFQQEGDGKVTVAGITFSGQAAETLSGMRAEALKERARNESQGVQYDGNGPTRGGRGGGGFGRG